MADEDIKESKLEHKLTSEEASLLNAKHNLKVASGFGYITNIVGLILNKASPLTAAILALAGFLIARIAGVFKKRATLKTIEADKLQTTMDAKDADKPKKRSDQLKIEVVAGSSPVGTESWQNSYLAILFLSSAAQAISTAFSSLTIQKGEGDSLGVLTPQAFQYLAIALSILAIIDHS